MPAVSNVLFVKVLVDESVINVPPAAGNVAVPEAVADACNTVVPDVDPVNVAPPELITGVVRVLLASVSEPARVASVPAVGRVTLVVPIVVNVRALAPLVAKLPASVMVLPRLFTPVPPYWPAITEPFHVPEFIVPTDVNDEPVMPLPNDEPDNTSVPLIL